MKMKASRFYSNWYLIALAMATLIFLSQMAIAEPLCTHCSVNLVKWALPRSELLMLGWIVATVNESWMARHDLMAALRRLPDTVRKARASTPSQTAEPSSTATKAGSTSD